MAGVSATHYIDAHLYDGQFVTRVICPDRDKGKDRPCAVWANDDGSDREDECTFQQYADNGGLDDWLIGTWQFPLVPIVEGGSGDDWHAEVKKEK